MSVKGEVRVVDGTRLLWLTLPVSGTSALNDFLPGEHVYIKPASGPLGPKTPFTIVGVAPNANKDSSGDAGSEVHLIVRDLSGPQTGWLGGSARLSRNVDVMVEGPYGEAKEYMPSILDPKTAPGSIMLVAGGVGATYALPIYLALLQHPRAGPGPHFVWVVRSFQDAKWGVELLALCSNNLNVEIYITGQDSGSSESKISDISKSKPGLVITSIGRRPDFKAIVDGTFSLSAPNVVRTSSMDVTSSTRSPDRSAERDYSPITVLTCAPPGMTRALRDEVGKHVLDYGREVHWHEEQFGLGSS